ncbi:hypothetical protein SPSIL_036930 [Sporomusa silvacetica DSM 10669]|uniref:Aldehyde ferredoxin oxidoreductase N-terminal domain-containing protein n=1 Tax=Sporomusa silvacetica DSM 10669 TaxID=1123289 RepID=A0ABZ3IP57_9FIRM|nr:aldehyde ferredoxin oxidoreductase C-terminal domain-containing protein [Sporomusa silvacetica]OZC19876.1 putative oxidoreductase YdhV [Sporomusa silvacetica DSM 10669]
MLKFLRINANQKTAIFEEVKEEYKFFGGRSLIAKLLNEEVDPACNALGVDNKLIICGGLLNGTIATTSGRLAFGGKSPLTGTAKEANVGGTGGAAFGKLGLKAIVIEDMPTDNEWSIIKISKDKVEFLPAAKYVGLNNYDLAAQLRKDMGTKISILSIGGAGEKGYRNSTIQVTDMSGNPARAAARGGLGALMGSKKIKAIILEDNGIANAEYEDKEKFIAAHRKFVEGIKANPVSGQLLPTFGTAALVNAVNGLGGLPTLNYSQGRWDKAEMISGEKLAEVQQSRGGKMGHACQPGCVIKCSNVLHDANGKYVTSGCEYETIALNGSNLGIDSLDFIAKVDRLCDDFGLDTMDTGATLGVCMEGKKIAFGDEKGALGLIEEMMAGTDFGKILGAGTDATAKYLGVKRVPTVKGQSLAAYDPRALKGTGVTYATCPMGADHTAGNSLGAPGVDPYKKEGQVALSTNLQVAMALIDSLGMCIFASFCIVDPANVCHLCDMMAAKFGGEWNPDRLFGLGVQSIALEKKFNKGAGFTAADDRLPEFMYTETLESCNSVFDVTDEEMAQAIPF